MSRNSPRSSSRAFPSIERVGQTAESQNHSHVNGFHVLHHHYHLTRSRVCIRDAKEAFSVRPRFPADFQYLTLDVEDNEEQNLIRLFPG